MKTITLTNGKIVGNFSSPHPFTFTDGSILPAQSNEEAERLKVTFNEFLHDNGDVELDFTLTPAIMHEMTNWMLMFNAGQVHVVFCPLPMITALKSIGYRLKKSPFRAVRIEDRINKLVSIEKQCL